MRFRPLNYLRAFGAMTPATGADPMSRPYLTRALQAVEGRLSTIYSRQLPDDDGQRLAAIAAISDPESSIWSDIMQVHYLETAREGLRSALQAMRPGRGRPQ